MEQWREELYRHYSTNKARENKQTKPCCNFFDYMLNRLLPKDKSVSIIDLAAGHGDLLYCLKQAGYKNVKGVDISEEEVKRGNEIGVSELIKDNIFDNIENTNETFGVIFLMDILEHLTREELFSLLKTVHKKLNNDGSVIIQVPNAGGLFGMRIRYGDLTHETAFTYNSLLQGLTTVGFKKIKAFEVSPIKKGLKGKIRFLLWHFLVFPLRLILILETGMKKHVLSQNIIIKAQN